MVQTETLTAALQQKYIEKASKVKSPIDCASYQADGTEHHFTFYSRSKSEMDSKILKWAFKLAEKNVGPFYKQLAMGWQPKVKQNDLNKNWARYLIALDETKKPVAYAMFRFDMDYNYAVLYCYEVQIEPAYQRLGLGKHMMSALENGAKEHNMEKLVLTVLKNNPNGLTFFEKIGYTLDVSSPDVLENAEYKILSKALTEN